MPRGGKLGGVIIRDAGLLYYGCRRWIVLVWELRLDARLRVRRLLPFRSAAVVGSCNLILHLLLHFIG